MITLKLSILLTELLTINFYFINCTISFSISSDTSIYEVNSDLLSICDQSVRNGLIINSRKSQAVAIGCENIPAIVLNENTIKLSESVTILGVALKTKLNWKNQLARLTSKVNAGLRSLWPHASIIRLQTRCIG